MGDHAKTTYSTPLFDVKDGAARITLNRPEVSSLSLLSLLSLLGLLS
jgi:enoyl-CoA hydratase/carnithine racemase